MEYIGTIKNEAGLPVCKMYMSIAHVRQNSHKNHKHTELEISHIIKGSGVYKTTSGDLDIKSGDIFLFSTNEQHCITNIYDENMYILNIQVQPSFILNLGGDYLKSSYMNIFFNRNENFKNRLDRNNKAINKVKELFDSIKSEFENEDADYESAVKLKLVELLICINRNFKIANESNDAATYSEHVEAISKALNYMDKNFDRQVTLDELAQIAFLSKSYFCTVFKKINGLTPWQYINIKRVNKAVELLKTTENSVLDIANECGYNSTASFNKIFRSVTGQTPKYFRK